LQAYIAQKQVVTNQAI
jgi:DNA polymerase-3 subunit gamma/tau